EGGHRPDAVHDLDQPRLFAQVPLDLFGKAAVHLDQPAARRAPFLDAGEPFVALGATLRPSEGIRLDQPAALPSNRTQRRAQSDPRDALVAVLRVRAEARDLPHALFAGLERPRGAAIAFDRQLALRTELAPADRLR